MKTKKIGHYLGMIVTAPGRELYRGCGKLKKRQDIVRIVLLVIVLAVLTVLLWFLRRNIFELLIGGGVLAVAFFYLYFLLLQHTDTVIGFVEKCCRPFEEAFARHARAFYGKSRMKKADKVSKKTDPAGTRESGQKDAGSKQDAEPKRHAHQSRAQRKKAQERQQSRTADESRHRGKAAYESRRETGNAGRNTQEQSSGRQKQERSERKASGSGERGSAGSRDRSRAGGAELEEAQLIYAVRIPYTTEEIRQKRNILLKRYHPDNAEGSEEMCKKINECYRILCRYAT